MLLGGNWWNPGKGSHPGRSENPRDLQGDLCNFRQQVEIYKSSRFQQISLRQYDCLDPNDKSFLRDYRKFNSKVWMLDRKLSAILTRSAFQFLALFLFQPQFPELLTTALSLSRSSSCFTSLATSCRGTSSPLSSPTRCRS